MVPATVVQWRGGLAAAAATATTTANHLSTGLYKTEPTAAAAETT